MLLFWFFLLLLPCVFVLFCWARVDRDSSFHIVFDCHIIEFHLRVILEIGFSSASSRLLAIFINSARLGLLVLLD